MNLKNLKDRDLLAQTKQLVQNERQILTKILNHLREVDRRKLFSELGYQSLFEYAVKELKYSEGQAGRRIQAMRLIKEIPEVEKKIESGALSLSNVSQLQSYFRETKKAEPQKPIKPKEKLQILERLENKSAREGQKILLQIQPQKILPKERQRIITETHTEVSFIMSEDLKVKLEELRSLLGFKGANMNFAELVSHMTGLSIETLRAKKFGKKRIQNNSPRDRLTVKSKQSPTNLKNISTTPTSELQCSKNPRYISKSVHHQIWTRDKGRCCRCGIRRNLNIDHVKPVALGGGSNPDNLRLLCFNCNQREAMRVFGVNYVLRQQKSGQD